MSSQKEEQDGWSRAASVLLTESAWDIVHHNWSGDSEIEKMMSTMQKALGIEPESKS